MKFEIFNNRKKIKELEAEISEKNIELKILEKELEKLKEENKLLRENFENLRRNSIEIEEIPERISSEKSVIIADSDLDGLISTYLFKKASFDFEPIFVGYGISEIIRRVEKTKDLIILDLGCYDDVYKEILNLTRRNAAERLIYIDHHFQTLLNKDDLSKIRINNKPFVELVCDERFWTASLVLNYLSLNSKPDEDSELILMAGYADGKINPKPEIIRKANYLRAAICGFRNQGFLKYLLEKLPNSYLKDEKIIKCVKSYSASVS